MKPLARILLFFLAATGVLSADHYQVYLLGGQSNGNGRADAAQLIAPLNAVQNDVRFYWHRTQAAENVGNLPEDQWIALAPGSGHGMGEPVFPKEFGCEVSFGRAMADAKPETNIAIIKYTHGGTNLYSQWSASGAQYATFVSTVRTALTALTTEGHTYQLQGMLWQQGEADTNGSNADNYRTNLTDLIERVRGDLFSDRALPFMIGSISDKQYSNITTVGSGPYKVRKAQEAVAAADSKVGIVITDGYAVRSDVIHFNHDGQVALGRNFASGIRALEGTAVIGPEPDSYAGTTGIFDENTEATNALDFQFPDSSLAAFKAAVLDAYGKNLGGAIDWETGVAATASSESSANNSLTHVGVTYGASDEKSLTVSFDRAMALYTNDVNGQVSVLSQKGPNHNAILPAGVDDTSYKMSFHGAGLAEIGAAVPARSTYGSMGVDFRATADFSSGESSAIDFTMGAIKGSSDTFLHFSARSNETITSLTLEFVDDNGQNLTNAQRRPVLDDLGFVTVLPSDTFATWISGYDVGSLDGIGDDPDGDGIDNGVENFFGTAPDEFSTGITVGPVDTDAGTFAFTHPQGILAADLTARYQWTKTLTPPFHADTVMDTGTNVNFNIQQNTPSQGTTTVIATVTGTATGRLFVRVEVAP